MTKQFLETVAEGSDRWGSIWQRKLLDPPTRRLARLLRVAWKTEAYDEISGGDLAPLAEVLVDEGIGVQSIHRIHARLHPERTALVDESRELTYRELDGEIDQLAAILADRFGVESGDPVALAMKNRVEYVVAWFALFRLGAPAVHVSSSATAEEIDYHVTDSGAEVLIGSSVSREAAVEALGERSGVAIVDADADDHAEASWSYRKLIREQAGDGGAPRGGEAGSGDNIVYTSGTTGDPKGTVRDFASMGIEDLARILDRLRVRTGDRHLVVTPIYHSGGQVFTLLNSALGATIHLLPEFDPERTLRTLSERRINSLFLVPTMIRQILNLPDEVHGAWPTPELRVLISGAAPYPTPLRRRAMRRFGTGTIYDFYGATELGWVTLIDGDEMRRKPGSVGRPIPGQEVRILDDDGDPVETGEVGTIWVRSEHTMSGYLPGAGDEDYRRGDWMTVDDLGYVDEDGYLFLAGRSRDMVISGGVNIYPVEIEETLEEHPAVAEAGAVGVDDEKWGEKLVAFVVPGGEAPEPETLDEWLRERLASYKIPKDWKFVDELPRNPTGKILKDELAERYDASGSRVSGG